MIEWQPCPKCWRYLIPYKDGKAQAVCYGPIYEHVARDASTLSWRYGELRWSHMTPELAIELDVGNMIPDPEMIDPLDVRIYKTIRTWIAWHAPHRRTRLPKAAVANIGTAADLEDED
jgi:hypothetical protein